MGGDYTDSGHGAGFGDSGIDSAAQAGGVENDPFQAFPEMNAIENGIEKIGDRAVVAVFGIRVVLGMVANGLQKASALQEGDDLPIFARAAVFPFVNFVSIGAEDGEEEQRPMQEAEVPRSKHHKRGGDREIPIALPPSFFNEGAGLAMVEDVGFDDPFADDGDVLAAIGVFEPVNETGGEIGGEDGADKFEGDFPRREKEVIRGHKKSFSGIRRKCLLTTGPNKNFRSNHFISASRW
jgi:hypothetical protein